MLFEPSAAAAAATLLSGGALLAVLWPVIEHSVLYIWFGALVIASLARLLLYFAYKKRTPDIAQAGAWAKLFIVGVALIAVVWVSAVIFLFPASSTEHQVFLAFVLAGMCASAVTTLSFLRVAILIYLLLPLSALIIQFLLSGTIFSLPMAGMTLLFFLLTSGSAMRIYSTTESNITIRLQANENEKALRESEERYRTIFSTAPLGIVQYDSIGHILSHNHLFAMLLTDGHDVRGKVIDEVLLDKEAIRILLAAQKSGEGVYTGDMSLPWRDKPLPLRIYFRSNINSENELLDSVAMVEDRSQDKRVERLKNEFVSTVSHELRTPLTAIKGSLVLLASDLVRAQPAMADELLANASRNSDRLLNLINDILDIDKIEQGKLEYRIEAMELMPFIEQVVVNNRPYGEQHKVSFVVKGCQEGLSIYADEQRLMQVVTNLLSNAAKFSSANSIVEIGVEDRVDEDSVCIAVKDYGCGIPEEFHDRIFTKFSQHDSSDVRKVGGTGLGLNISKAIVEYHCGRLEFESVSGEGTTFYVILPKTKKSAK